MLQSPLLDNQEPQVVSEDDLPLIKHQFRRVYGWMSEEDFDKIPIPEFFEMWQFVSQEVRKEDEFKCNLMMLQGAKRDVVRKWLDG